MELDISLMTCPECNNVFQYYDFLSHTSHMCNRNNINNRNNRNNRNNNNNTISDMDIDIDEDEEDIDIDETDDSGDYNNAYINNRIINLNGLNDYGNYRNLYNPMINRNFNIHNIHNTSDMNTLITNFESINIINNKDTFNYTIKKELDLEKYNKKVQCNERTECSICLVSYPEHTTFYLMHCNHSFCIECCEKWYSANSLCPLCRSHYKFL
jgi:hypothetical protein